MGYLSLWIWSRGITLTQKIIFTRELNICCVGLVLMTATTFHRIIPRVIVQYILHFGWIVATVSSTSPVQHMIISGVQIIFWLGIHLIPPYLLPIFRGVTENKMSDIFYCSMLSFWLFAVNFQNIAAQWSGRCDSNGCGSHWEVHHDVQQQESAGDLEFKGRDPGRSRHSSRRHLFSHSVSLWSLCGHHWYVDLLVRHWL